MLLSNTTKSNRIMTAARILSRNSLSRWQDSRWRLWTSKVMTCSIIGLMEVILYLRRRKIARYSSVTSIVILSPILKKTVARAHLISRIQSKKTSSSNLRQSPTIFVMRKILRSRTRLSRLWILKHNRWCRLLRQTRSSLGRRRSRACISKCRLQMALLSRIQHTRPSKPTQTPQTTTIQNLTTLMQTLTSTSHPTPITPMTIISKWKWRQFIIMAVSLGNRQLWMRRRWLRGRWRRQVARRRGFDGMEVGDEVVVWRMEVWL